MSVCPSVRTCVRLRIAVLQQKVPSILMKLGMWVEVNEYDPIQGQGQEPFRVGNPATFNSCLLRNLQ